VRVIPRNGHYSTDSTISIKEQLMQTPQIYIDEKEVAKIRNCGLSTLRNERHEGRGIAYIKDSRRVKYFLPDVYEYMEARRIIPQYQED
jgi:hypothetical protein